MNLEFIDTPSRGSKAAQVSITKAGILLADKEANKIGVKQGAKYAIATDRDETVKRSCYITLHHNGAIVRSIPKSDKLLIPSKVIMNMLEPCGEWKTEVITIDDKTIIKISPLKDLV